MLPRVLAEERRRALLRHFNVARARHAQPDHGDDVALDLVRPSAEGEDGLAPGLVLQPAPQDRPWRPLDQVPGLTDHLEQQPIDLQRQLGAVDLGGRRVSGIQSFVRRPRHLPVQQLEHVDLGVRLGQADLDPLVIDQCAPVLEPVPCAHRRTSVRLLSRPEAGQIATRSWFSWFVISFQPWFSAPTRFAAGTRTSS